MAKTKKTPAATAPSQVKHEVLGILFIFLGAFTLLALISYHHQDPSFFTRTSKLPLNYGGKIGANLSEILIQFAGLSSFVFSVLCFSFAARLFQGNSFPRLVGNFFWVILALLSFATFVSLQFNPIQYGGATIPAGGIVGGAIAKTLSAWLNFWGASLFTFCAFLVALVFSTPFSAAKLFKFLANVLLLSIAYAIKGLQKTYSAIQDAAIFQKKAAAQTITQEFSKKLKNDLLIAERSPKREIEAFDRETDEEIAESADDEIQESLWDAAAVRKALKVNEKPKKPKKTEATQVTAHVGTYTLPSLSLLNQPAAIENKLDRGRLQSNAHTLEQKLLSFGIEGNVVAISPGPVITMYEFRPGPGIKISKIENLSADLALALSAQSIRIVAPIPGKDVVGIEIPNEDRESVSLREILGTEEFQTSSNIIPLAVGKNIAGIPVVSDLGKMPHLLIAGAPGAGKSVFVNTLICSLLYKFSPNQLRLIMVDPKQLELNLYENIPHLLLPVVDDPKKASNALKWAVKEMDRRYNIMAKSRVRKISEFNKKLEDIGSAKMGELLCPQDEAGMPIKDSLSHLFEHDEKGKPRVEELPYILVIIDEFADLIMVARKDVEESVVRIAQKARAAGIHLVIATQRPSVDVVTGLIKSNLPSRVSFKVPSRTDSRTILDQNGADSLLGQGDMLFIPPGSSQLVRLHGAFVSNEEIEKICEHWRSQGTPVYKEEILEEPTDSSREDLDGVADDLYQDAITFVREFGTASASMLQRRFKVGYNRAARMIDAMEAQGIVGPGQGAKPREVLY